MPARRALQPGYVLRTQPYGDTSLLVEAWTRDQGRIGLVAKGAREPRSRQRALLQSLQPLWLSWLERGDLGTLSGVEAAAPAFALRGETLFCAWYLNELLLKLLPRHDPHPTLFEAYATALAELDRAQEPALRRFELRLLAELGYGLELSGELDPAQQYRFDGENPPVPVLAGDRSAVSGVSLIALRDERFDDPRALRDARRILRSALSRRLGGQELQTARLLRELRSRIPSAAPADPGGARSDPTT
jgi:DNA repair protein RecO (recombination protein O)